MTIDFAQPLMLLMLLAVPLLFVLHKISRNTLPRRRKRLVLAVRLLVMALLVLSAAEPKASLVRPHRRRPPRRISLALGVAA